MEILPPDWLMVKVPPVGPATGPVIGYDANANLYAGPMLEPVVTTFTDMMMSRTRSQCTTACPPRIGCSKAQLCQYWFTELEKSSARRGNRPFENEAVAHAVLIANICQSDSIDISCAESTGHSETAISDRQDSVDRTRGAAGTAEPVVYSRIIDMFGSWVPCILGSVCSHPQITCCACLLSRRCSTRSGSRAAVGRGLADGRGIWRACDMLRESQVTSFFTT
jgi:hypothetical protein